MHFDIEDFNWGANRQKHDGGGLAIPPPACFLFKYSLLSLFTSLVLSIANFLIPGLTNTSHHVRIGTPNCLSCFLSVILCLSLDTKNVSFTISGMVLKKGLLLGLVCLISWCYCRHVGHISIYSLLGTILSELYGTINIEEGDL